MKTFLEFVALNFRGAQKKTQIATVANILAGLFTLPKPPKALGVSQVAVMKTEATQRFKAHENTEGFWLDANSPLHSWLKGHGVSYKHGILPRYSQGGAGRAYFLDDEEHVVKMSANRVEANVADMVKGREDLPTNIIDVLYLGQEVYAILQYFVNVNLPQEIKDAADYLTMIVDDYPDMEGYPQTEAEQRQICTEILQNNGGDMSLLPHMMMILEVLIRLYNATGFKHDDAGPTNIAMHQGKLVMPDLGPNEGGKFDALQSLAQIAKNRQTLGLPKRKSI
jgi:hypothetical protein